MNFPSVSQFSIAKGTGGTTPPEMYIPLWWYSGYYVQTGANSAGNTFLVKGSGSSSPSGGDRLHTLGAWNPNTKFALEVAAYGNGGYTAYAVLWDFTSNVQVSGSAVQTTSTTATLLRSGQFTLTAGHQYGVSIYSSSNSYQASVLDASIIVFPQ